MNKHLNWKSVGRLTTKIVLERFPFPFERGVSSLFEHNNNSSFSKNGYQNFI
jgi:hypothetical protein